MKNPTIETLVAAAEMATNGVAMKAILAATGLNYSQAWYYIRTEELRASGELVTNPTAEDAKILRDAGHSWGEIAVRMQMAESKIRRMYTDETALKSQGQRIGKGGRFYYGPDRGAPLYEGGLEKTGTRIPKGENYQGAILAAEGMKLIHLSMDELKAQAEALGIIIPKKATKAGLATKIRKAQAVSA